MFATATAAVTANATATAVSAKGYIPILPAPASTRAQLRALTGSAAQSACDLCRVNTLCLPDGISASQRSEYTALIAQHRKLAAGEALYHAGDPFTHLYLVKTGTFKTVVLSNDGREQITGFRLPGDTLGVDAISYHAHASDAMALEAARVCAIPFSQLARLAQQSAAIQGHLHRLLAQEVVSDQGVMLLLGRMTAEERVVTFLLNLARRFEARGQSRHAFNLSMTREEIGIYLGLTLETVSRCFSRMKHSGWLALEGRLVRIIDYDAMCQVAGVQPRFH